MWVAIVIAIIALLMVAFMPKPNIENARAAKLGDFQVPRAKWGDPMPLAWGRVRQKSPVTLWFGDLKAIPITKKVSSGLFSSKRVTVGYMYYLGLDLLLAAGPGIRLRRIWSGTKEIWSGNLTADGTISINLPDLFGGVEERGGLVGTVRFYTGSFNSVQNAYLQSVLDPDVPAYNGKARAVFENFYFGTTTSLGNLSFELEYRPNALMPATALMPNGIDVNPFEICYDGITNQWARFGNNTTDIDIPSWQACAQQVYDEGLGASMLLQSSITGKDFLEEIMRHVDGLLYQDPGTGKIIAKLIRNDYDEGTLPVLDESIVKSIGNFSKTTWDNTFNQCRVQFKDRNNNYDESVAVAQDFANVNFQNKVKTTEVSMPLCFEPDVASTLAGRQLSFLNVPLFKCDLVCNRKAANLRPGDVFKLNWGPYGLTNLIMRVSKISLGTLTNGEVKITCVQDRYSETVPTFAPPDNTGWQPPVTSALPVAIRRILEVPYWFAQFLNTSPAATQGLLMVVAQPPSGVSVHFDADITTDADAAWANPLRALEDAPYHASGTLTAPYANTVARATGYDAVGFTLTVPRPEGIHDNAGAYDTAGQMLLFMNDEIFMASDVTNNGNGTYTFSGLYRALLDTDFGSHAAGDRCYIVRQADGLINYLFNDTSTWRVRLLDNTVSATLNPASALTDVIPMSRRAFKPAPPDYVTINGVRTPPATANNTALTFAWRSRNRKTTNIISYSDASETAEAGTDYQFRYRINGGAWSSPVYIAGTTHSMAGPGVNGTFEAEVYARRDGLLSRVADTCTIELITPPAAAERLPTAFTQSSVYGGLTATVSNMRDASYTTGAATGTAPNQFIRADLGSAQSVNEVRVAGGNLSGWGGVAGYLNGAVIQYSLDDVSWTTVATISGVTDSAPQEKSFAFTAVSARYWRILQQGYLAATEFRLYG